MLTLTPYATDVRDALRIATALAKEYRHPRFDTPHLLGALLHDDVGLSSSLRLMQVDVGRLRQWAEVRLRQYPKSARPVTEPPADERIDKVLNVADIVRLKLSLDQLDAACLLAALCKPGVGFSAETLKSFPLTEQQLLEAYVKDLAGTPVQGESGSSSAPRNGTAGPAGKGKHLSRFCVDKTAAARAGQLDPIVGRNREIRKIAEILGRRSKPNALLVGEPGVGKTALVEGFARLIVSGEVPERLREASLLELDLGALIAGAAYKGEIEERLKGIIAEIKERPGTILFIDEIHALLDPQGGAGGAANLLKPELARGAITVIGATTHGEFRKYIEIDDAFRRRFATIEVEEPSEEKAVRMLRALAPVYGEHHGLELTEAALRESVQLATRYLKDRQLPDAAIDLIDRTAAAVRMMSETSSDEVKRFAERLEAVIAAGTGQDPDYYLAELKWFEQELRDSVSPILLGSVADLREVAAMERSEDVIDYLRGLLTALRELKTDKATIEAADIAAMVAYAKGIPIGKIRADEKDKLDEMAGRLAARVVGQDHAIASIASAVKVSRAGIADGGRPVGSFFLLGPTGTGKTELAKALAEYLFNDEAALIRFDMSEYTQQHAVDTLTGAPPGYVGYEEGGILVNRIRQQPYSVVLFDEIEKAHPEIFKVFLQVLDDGKLTDKQGKVGDFTNAIILFTSNVGQEFIVRRFGAGEVPGQAELTEQMSTYFKDEFLGRLTEIVPFAPITEDNILAIFRIQLRKLIGNLRLKGITLELTPRAERHYALLGFSPRFGARPLRRVILNDLQKPISQRIIAGVLADGHTLTIDVGENQQPVYAIN